MRSVVEVRFSKATGLSAAEYAEKTLFKHLQINGWRWTSYQSNISVGGAGLYLRPRDMAKLGQLYLQEGVWNGVQVVPAE
jgi:CubicO group peptidase (beta-lactamase class C family)